MHGGLLLLLGLLINLQMAFGGTLILPKAALESSDLGVVVNDADPLSVRIADYYMAQRNIPPENLIHIRFRPNRNNIPATEFKRLFSKVSQQTPARVQAYALTWGRPYRVDCMSITSAFATGFNRGYCAEKKLPNRPCGITAKSPYFVSTSLAPYKDLGIRPTMSLAATTFDDAKRLIDRGIASDGSFPEGAAYLLNTSDKNRSVRARFFPQVKRLLGHRIQVHILQQDQIRERHDVMFYFTGLTRVEELSSLTFLPGAVADHLTSAGGRITPVSRPGSQMSSLRWLEAGATGSYGTVVEPCNFPTKFSNPGILIALYLNGASLIEAYWKSMAWPGEGLFIGEPLATPYGMREVRIENGQAVVRSGALAPGVYELLVAEKRDGPYRSTGRYLNPAQRGERLVVDGLKTSSFYRLKKIQALIFNSEPRI